MSDFFDDVFTAYCNSYNECASCPLGKETGDCRDLFAREMKAWAAKQVDGKHLGFDGYALFLKENGKDANVPTTLPKWVKVGQWVKVVNAFSGDEHFGEIVEVKRDYYAVRVVGFTELFGFGVDSVSKAYPIRFRPYTYEEAKGLLGKTMEYTVKNAIASKYHSMLICKVSSDDNNGDTFIHSCRFSDWVDYEATIDGVPIGVPVIDEEAMKEVE